MNYRIFLLGIVGLAAAISGAWWARDSIQSQPTSPTGGGYVLEVPRELPAFELVDQDGQSFSEQRFRGHWSLLYFGFSYCPDVCPSSLVVMSLIRQALEEETDLDDRYFLVSVDPARDTPERLKEYVTYFDPSFQALTGEFSQLDLLTGAAGAVYRVPDEPANEDYLVAHSSTLTLLNPAGQVQAIFTSPFDARTIAETLARLAAKDA